MFEVVGVFGLNVCLFRFVVWRVLFAVGYLCLLFDTFVLFWCLVDALSVCLFIMALFYGGFVLVAYCLLFIVVVCMLAWLRILMFGGLVAWIGLVLLVACVV